MFPYKLFPPRLFPPRLFPEHGAILPPPGVGGGLFPDRLFPGLLFPHRLFPGGLPTTQITTAETLADAVFARLAPLVSNGTLPGEVWHGFAATNVLPFCVVLELDEHTEEETTAGLNVPPQMAEAGELQFTVYATSPVTAFTAGEAIRAALTDIDLSYTDVRIMYFRQRRRMVHIDPDPDPNGDPIFAEIRVFAFEQQRSI